VLARNLRRVMSGLPVDAGEELFGRVNRVVFIRVK
jgi:hypothetical protein